MKQKQKTYIVLPSIRSVHNVGSIFRTADAVGVTKILLVGTTPTPIDRFGRRRKDFAKVALGAEDSVEWEYYDTFDDALSSLEENTTLVAVEQDASSKMYTEYTPPYNNTAFIFGEETQGLPREVLEHANACIEIPMQGTKESLNVSVAAGIILFHYRDVVLQKS